MIEVKGYTNHDDNYSILKLMDVVDMSSAYLARRKMLANIEDSLYTQELGQFLGGKLELRIHFDAPAVQDTGQHVCASCLKKSKGFKRDPDALY